MDIDICSGICFDTGFVVIVVAIAVAIAVALAVQIAEIDMAADTVVVDIAALVVHNTEIVGIDMWIETDYEMEEWLNE